MSQNKHLAQQEYFTFKYSFKDAENLNLNTLSPNETAYAATLTHPKRQSEFLKSHLLLQDLLQNQFQIQKPNLIRVPSGQWCLENKELCFSISHSGEFIYIGISEKPIGVDVQRVQKESSKALYKKVFHLNEIEFLKDHTHLEYCIFSMKESYGKSKGSGIQNVSILDFSKFLKPNFKYLNFIETHENEPQFEMTVERLEDFVYTSCVLLKK